MNTEIFDYLKTLAKREFFFVSVTNLFCSLTIIVCGVISLRTGSGTLLYTIMFACATVIMWLNCYKCFKRESKNGIVFAVIGLAFATITGICAYALIGGI